MQKTRAHLANSVNQGSNNQQEEELNHNEEGEDQDYNYFDDQV